MNTSKQVNVMVGLLFLLVISFGIYFVWDQNVRSGRAADRQVEENAVRGAKLFSTNCRVCHGPNGLGALENPNFPGAALNVDGNRPTEQGVFTPLRQRLLDTVKCGRVGTLMPPWAQAQGGPLNDTQIDQLVTLIVGSGEDGPSRNPNAVSQHAWEIAREVAEEQDTLLTLSGEVLRIAEGGPLGANDTVIILNDAHIGFAVDQFLRIEDEIVQIKSFPASSKLTEAVSATATVLKLEASGDFQVGTIVQADQERMRVLGVNKDEKTIQVQRGVDGTPGAAHGKGALVQAPHEEIVVLRGAFDTEAVEHPDGAQVFNGPIPPPEEPLTGEAGTPPCGQLAAVPQPADGAAPTPSPGQPKRPAGAQAVAGQFTEPVNGLIETTTRDNFFTKNNFKVGVGEQVIIRVTNEGQQLHNLRVAGLDGQWDSADDFVAPPGDVFLKNGEKGELLFTLAQAATLVFRCDVHPTQMWGQISVE